MSYGILSKQNTTTNIYLVFNEITISPISQVYTAFDSPTSETFKKYRHADGSSNKSTLLQTYGLSLDPDTESAPLVLPAYNYTSEGASHDQDYILQNVKKYFEPFNVNISIAENLPVQWSRIRTSQIGSLDPSAPRYVKMLPPSLRTRTNNFNALPPKFYPYKRAAWFQELDGSRAVFDCAYPWRNFAIMGYNAPNLENLIEGTVHEIGHLYNLQHQGDIRDSPELLEAGLSYYGIGMIGPMQTWVPIMGLPNDPALLVQWSNTDYKNAIVNSSSPTPPYQNEILVMLRAGIKLEKSPGDNFRVTVSGPSNRTAGTPPSRRRRQNISKDSLYSRYALETEQNIIGMIGYEKDYDIIKALLPAGATNITVVPHLEGKEDRSLLDPRVEILYCQSEIKKNPSESENNYPEIWTTNNQSVPNLKNKNIFHKTLIENDEEENVHSFGVRPEENTFTLVSLSRQKSSLTLHTNALTLVYIKIMGNWMDPVNKFDKKPTAPDQGHSNYGSIGKYKLELSRPSLIKEDNYSIPYGRFEEFNYCKDSLISEETIWLLVQDEGDTSKGDPSKNNIWSLEMDCTINGRIKMKKFLVYGRPLDINAPEPPGKFFLIVPIDGVCKKQEFIVGMPRPENNQ
jgi:hypothetical protein